MKHAVKNQLGMSLLEVMMAVAMLSVVSLGVMTLNKNMNKTSKTAQRAMDIDGVMREIQNHMTNRENCSATVVGASGSGSTVITSLKSIDTRASTNGSIQAHPRIKASTMAAPAFLAPGLIINGMALRWLSNTTTGSNYELAVTFVKSVKAATQTTTAAADGMFGPNIVVRKIPLQLDNCDRYVAFGNTQQAAAGTCNTGFSGQTGATVGSYVAINSLAGPSANSIGITDTQYAVACMVCPAGARTSVKGCL